MAYFWTEESTRTCLLMTAMDQYILQSGLSSHGSLLVT